MSKSQFVYVTYIRTTPEKLWSALTDMEFMKEYWFGCHCESDWKAGSSWKIVSPSGEVLDKGEIIEALPPGTWNRLLRVAIPLVVGTLGFVR